MFALQISVLICNDQMLLYYLIYVFTVLLLAVFLLAFYVKSIINVSLRGSLMLSSYSVLGKFFPISRWPLNSADVGASLSPSPPPTVENPHTIYSQFLYTCSFAPTYSKDLGSFSTVAVTIEKIFI